MAEFSRPNFGNLPIWYILQALEQGAKLNAETLHHQELGIATLTACFVNANRDPKKGQAAKAADFCYFKQSPDDTGPVIPAAACDVFFSLVAEQLLPSWVLDVAPVELLRKHKGTGAIRKPRAWIGENLLLILPRVEGTTVTAALAINHGAIGGLELHDPDTGTPFYLSLDGQPQISWALDAEFELINHV